MTKGGERIVVMAGPEMIGVAGEETTIMTMTMTTAMTTAVTTIMTATTIITTTRSVTVGER
jgi:hypothetical protein